MQSIIELENRLSNPSNEFIAEMASLRGDILVIGAGGKLGPNIIRLAMCADKATGVKRNIFAASRFSDPNKAAELEAIGAKLCKTDITLKGAMQALPDAENVLYLVGSRFGTTGREAEMWFTNSFLPGKLIERFKSSRIVALSTGNVYPLVAVNKRWPTEQMLPDPLGEYAMSCLGRERIMSHCAEQYNVPLTLIRLNYSVEMRYGPIVDLVRLIRAQQPVDLSMGYLNLVWQGYSNEVILRSFLRAATPNFVLNVTGPELVSVRAMAEQIGKLLQIGIEFVGTEEPTALMSDASLCHNIFGFPKISVETLVEQTVQWLESDLPIFNNSTGFQNRKGTF